MRLQKIYLSTGKGHVSEEECKSKNGAGAKTKNGNVDLSHVSWSIHRKKQLQKNKRRMYALHACIYICTQLY